MKKLLAIISISAVLIPQLVFAAYGLTQSAQLVRASSQYFSRADDALLEPGSAFTVECWVKLSGVIGGGTNSYVVAAKTNSGGGQRGFILKVTNDGSDNISLLTQTSSTGASYNGGTSVAWSAAPSNGIWYHVAWTMNGSTEKYYVDGAQMGSDQTSAISSIFDSTAGLFIGREGSGDNFNGSISLCRVWQEVRTQTQIANNICNVLGTTTNLSGEWTLDNTLNDNSGNSLTLTNNNSITFGTDTPSFCAQGAGSVPTYIGILES